MDRVGDVLHRHFQADVGFVLLHPFGALGRDAEAKISKAGKNYVRLSVRIGDGDDAQWMNVTSFDQNAIGAIDRLVKGARVYCEGLRWFQNHPLIYDNHPAGEHWFDYYLEGTARNFGPIRAFPSGLAALENGQYFVSRLDTNPETVCRTLALRGVICADHD